MLEQVRGYLRQRRAGTELDARAARQWRRLMAPDRRLLDRADVSQISAEMLRRTARAAAHDWLEVDGISKRR